MTGEHRHVCFRGRVDDRARIGDRVGHRLFDDRGNLPCDAGKCSVAVQRVRVRDNDAVGLRCVEQRFGILEIGRTHFRGHRPLRAVRGPRCPQPRTPDLPSECRGACGRSDQRRQRRCVSASARTVRSSARRRPRSRRPGCAARVGLARNTASSATSSGWPMRRRPSFAIVCLRISSGVVPLALARCSNSVMMRSVSVMPGWMTLTFTPSCLPRTRSPLEKFAIAAFTEPPIRNMRIGRARRAADDVDDAALAPPSASARTAATAARRRNISARSRRGKSHPAARGNCRRGRAGIVHQHVATPEPSLSRKHAAPRRPRASSDRLRR